MNDAMDSKTFQITVFCDLSKTFDTISHPILLEKKLNNYEIRGIVNKWFEGYLKYRQQYVVYNEGQSSFSKIYLGVPQGSVLGPILFLIYVNDITRTSNILNFLWFADDATIFVKGRDIHDLQ